MSLADATTMFTMSLDFWFPVSDVVLLDDGSWRCRIGPAVFAYMTADGSQITHAHR